MENLKVPGAQCDNVGESQGYAPISIRHEQQKLVLADGTTQAVPVMVTHWRPTDAELAILALGGYVKLELLGTGWPPSKLTVDIEAQGRG